jgi:WhiB family redox-sensing transcriptional regulator
MRTSFSGQATIDQWESLLGAKCRGMGVELFYSPDGEKGKERTAREARAKDICKSCEVLMACRDIALTNREPFGVWGGMTEKERNEHLRGKTRRSIEQSSRDLGRVAVG